MRGRTQFWLGSLSLALVLGLLCGGLLGPRPAGGAGDEELVGGTSYRYALVLGLPGLVAGSQTLYFMDDTNDIFYVLEYNSRSHKIEPTKVSDLRRWGTEIIRARAKRDEKKK
jgi:hypothetical protein